MKTLGKFKTLGLATVLTGVAVAGSIVVAQSVSPNQSTQEQGQQGRFARRGGWGGHGDHSFGDIRGGDRLFSQLNLTDDQKAKMKQLHESFAERNKPLRDQLQAKRQELQQARQGDTFNESLATQKLTEMASLEAKLMAEEFKLHQETLAILTPEQKTQLEQARAQFKTKRGDRPGRGERRINQ
jgi:protein CpxP